ncbi:hypothetical protein KCV07_g26, partial [Aureobasidium melanogenum]
MLPLVLWLSIAVLLLRWTVEVHVDVGKICRRLITGVGLACGHISCSVDHVRVWEVELIGFQRTSRGCAGKFHHGHTPWIVGVHGLGCLRLLLLLLARMIGLRHALSSHKLCILTDDVVKRLSRHGVHGSSLGHDLSIGRHVHLLHAITSVPVPRGIGIVAAHDSRVREVIRAKGVEVAAPTRWGFARGSAQGRRGVGASRAAAAFRACRELLRCDRTVDVGNRELEVGLASMQDVRALASASTSLEIFLLYKHCSRAAGICFSTSTLATPLMRP